MNLLNIIGIPNAMAQTAVPTVNQSTTATTAATPATGVTHPGGGIMEMVWMLAAFIIIFYFFLIRPQSKRQKEQRNLINSLKKGDEVTTVAGLVGKIIEINGEFVVLNIADNVNVTFQKNYIAATLPKGTLKNL